MIVKLDYLNDFTAEEISVLDRIMPDIVSDNENRMINSVIFPGIKLLHRPSGLASICTTDKDKDKNIELALKHLIHAITMWEAKQEISRTMRWDMENVSHANAACFPIRKDEMLLKASQSGRLGRVMSWLKNKLKMKK